MKTEYRDVENWEVLQDLLDKEYEKVCSKCKEIVNNIRELELELESRSNK